MENSTTSSNAASEDTGILSYVSSLSSENSCVSAKHSTCNNTESALKITFPEAHSVQFNGDKDNLTDEELAINCGGLLHLEDISEQSCGQNAIAKQVKTCNSEDITCQVLRQSVSSSTTAKSLNKCATFPSEEVKSCPSIMKRVSLLSKLLQDDSSSDSESHAYARSLSVPASFRPISAMKGGREQNGITPKTDLHVKWSPEVYDPPTTSMSHSVKNHHQRPKAKKKDHNKHKHKSKSSRGGNGDKNHASRRSISNVINPLDMRLQPHGEIFSGDGFKQPDVEVLEYSVSGREAKCGSSVLRETLSKVHLPIAEAL